MPADTTVKFLSSTMTSAPQLSGSTGALLTILQQCLVDGWGLSTVDSIVVTSGVAKVTRAAGHPFVDGQVALIAGSTPAALNGEKRVTVLSPTQYTFEASGVPDGTATGTVTHKVAPLGWANPFAAAGSVGVFKSPDAAASGHVLRVDDSGTGSAAKNARVLAYEAMTDLNTGSGGSPSLLGQGYPANVSGGLYWLKSSANDATARLWYVIGDARAFYLCVAHTSGSTAFSTMAFGDFSSVRSSTLDCLLAGPSADNTGTSSGGSVWDLDYSDGSALAPVFFPRSFTNVGGPTTQGYKAFPTFGTAALAQRSGATGMLSYPNGPDGGLYVAPVYVSEPTTRALRGSLPGFYAILNSVGPSLSNAARFSGVVNLPGRQLLTLNSSTGAFAFDITGPWTR